MWMEQQVAKRRVKRGYRRIRRHTDDNDIFEEDDDGTQISKSRNRKHPDPNDPLWTDMWYLVGYWIIEQKIRNSMVFKLFQKIDFPPSYEHL